VTQQFLSRLVGALDVFYSGGGTELIIGKQPVAWIFAAALLVMDVAVAAQWGQQARTQQRVAVFAT
jgi:hypothetical protein